jgi:hypothetical protein
MRQNSLARYTALGAAVFHPELSLRQLEELTGIDRRQLSKDPIITAVRKRQATECLPPRGTKIDGVMEAEDHRSSPKEGSYTELLSEFLEKIDRGSLAAGDLDNLEEAGFDATKPAIAASDALAVLANCRDRRKAFFWLAYQASLDEIYGFLKGVIEQLEDLAI